MIKQKPIALALQGGGSHGAFTWGVLDEILADGRLKIEAISGTSAGSMNAVLAAYGLETGGAEQARALLQNFWQRVAQCGTFSPLQPSLLDRLTGSHNLEYSPALFGFEVMSRIFSPTQLNPLGINPLKDILRDLIKFERLHDRDDVLLYISATNVRTGALKVFHNREITVEALLASACLPFLFPAVEINGHHYWDGGYMGNPTLYPLIHRCATPDVLIVQINPIYRAEVPTSANAIIDRVNEISFNSSLIHELSGLMIINKLIKANHLDKATSGLRHLHLHMVQDQALMSRLSYASKLNADYDFMLTLRDAGKAATRAWLDAHYDSIGKDSSLDLTRLHVEAA